MTDDQRLAEIERRLTATTPGPWIAYYLPYNGGNDPVVETANGVYICQTVYDMQGETQVHNVDADTEFIAAAPDDLRYLVKRVHDLAAENAALVGLLTDILADHPAHVWDRNLSPAERTIVVRLSGT